MEKEKYPSNGTKIGCLLIVGIIAAFAMVGSCSADNSPSASTASNQTSTPPDPQPLPDLTDKSAVGTTGDQSANTDDSDDQAQASDLNNTIEVANKLYSNMGATFSKTQANGLTTFNITIKQDVLVANVPNLQQLGVLNPDVTQTGVNTAPYMITAFIMQYIATAIIDNIYDDKSVDKLRVNEYVDEADDYGNMKHRLAMSFDFNRHLNKRIDWDNFKTESLAKIAPNFQMTQWFTEKLYEESQQ